MKKFILDTNVIISDPYCIRKFEENEIYIPLVVIEELDKLKKGQDEKARNARMFSRTIDKLMKKGKRTNDKMSTGVDLKHGGKVFVTVVDVDNDIPIGMNLSINDDMIIYTAFKIGGIIVSKDLNVRLKADALSIPAEDYKAGKLQVEDNESLRGHRVIRLTADQIDQFRSEAFVEYKGEYPNEYFIIKEHDNDRSES